mgnify:CR=1 FL=1
MIAQKNIFLHGELADGAVAHALFRHIGQAAFNPLARIVIVVDDDIDVMHSAAVRFAIGSRWQPATAIEILKAKRAFALDPGSPDRKTTSKAKAGAHIQAGAKKVIRSAPGEKDVDRTAVCGVNHASLKEGDTVI